ncbi:hypothetical protein GH5_07694 [Leishmania sp. Ghana 2012 LV757]|uniref:hypothetical protein n=1 Tax=Leishmania sp. Ghana 2012 LV757 TaxID=2803181 RepID=UPI001B5F76FB|nr:hypothetical protein GH5_07694 [Leishmania sp. Ghana 2012 LV757]
MSDHMADFLHGHRHHRSGDAGLIAHRTGIADTSEEVGVVSATTRASSPEAAFEQPRQVSSSQQRRGSRQRASWHHRQSGSTAATDFSLPTPPPQRRFMHARPGRENASEDALATDVSLSSVTVVAGSIGSSSVLNGTRTSALLAPAVAHGTSGAASADDDEERQAERMPELSWNPRVRAYSLSSATHHGGRAKRKQCLGHQPWPVTEGESLSAAPHWPPRRTSLPHARLHFSDIPVTLAELLCRYLVRSPPSSPAAAAVGAPRPADGDVCIRFLSVRWGFQEMSTPSSPSNLHRQSPAEARSWAAASPSPTVCPPPRPPPGAVSPSSSPQLSAIHAINKHGASEEQQCSSSSRSATNCNAPRRRQQSRQQEHLWNLLTHYPRDASACLALGLSVCAALDAMRAAPPPALPVEVLQDIAAATATDINAFVHACEEAWQTADKASPKPTATLPPLATSVNDVTCVCGCLAAGQLLDPALYRFHLLYYRHHSRYASLRRCDGDNCRAGEPAVSGAQHDGERNAMEEARAAMFGRPHDQRPPPQHSQCAPPPLPSRLSCAQGTSPTVLLPLIAVQTLSGFVGASNARRRSAVSRQRCRWRQRETWRDSRRSTATPSGPRATAAPTQPVAPSAKGAALDKQDIRRPSTAQASQTDKIEGVKDEADPIGYYADFCDETERLWAVMASVLLAWKQLEQCVSVALLVPRLEVLPSSVSRTQRFVPPPSPSPISRLPALSPLARAAASMRLHTTVLEGMLLRAAHGRADAAASTPFFACGATLERAALTRLRVRLLSIAPRLRGTVDAHVSDDFASSLRMMESFVYGELRGRIARLPLWCAVAVEVLQLHVEQFCRDRTLLARRAQEENGNAATQDARGADVRAVWTCVHSRRVQQVVLLAIRLMTLPCVFVNGAPAPSLAAERAEASSASPPCQTRRWRRTSLADDDVRAAAKAAAEAAATTALPASVVVPVPVSAATVEQLSAVMSQHPLFGVAVAVVGGGVPLHWAEACVAPRAMTVNPHPTTPPAPSPGESNSRCEDGMDARRTPAAVVAAADAEAQRELRRLVQLLHKWLREAEGRP